MTTAETPGIAPVRKPSARGRAASAAAVARTQLSGARRAAAEASLRVFAQTYLTTQFKDPPSRMHFEIADLLEDATRRRGTHIAIAAPRGHAKSTLVSLAYALWSICYDREAFIVLISDTAEQAKDLLSDIRRELETNSRLAEDFPDATRPPPPAPPGKRNSRWRSDDIVTGNNIRVLAVGAGQKLRGRRNRADRPTLIIIDDLENEALVRSTEQREQRWDWLMRSVIPSGAKSTNVVVVGTILHFDGALARLTDPIKTAGWTSRMYKAVESWAERSDLWDRWEAIFCRLESFEDEAGPEAAHRFFDTQSVEMLRGVTVLWPEREDYYDLMVQRARNGRPSFDAEKQNCPVNPADCLFADSNFVYWDEPAGGGFKSADELIASLGRHHGRIVGACDPSLGKPGGKGDLSAIVVVYRHTKTQTNYVIDVDMRRRTPDETIEMILTLHKRWQFNQFAVEAVQFQDMMVKELERRARNNGRYLWVRGVTPKTSKINRVSGLQPLIAAGLVRFSRRQVALLEQLRQFPHGAHDDGPDALEMVVHAAHKPGARIVQTYPGFHL